MKPLLLLALLLVGCGQAAAPASATTSTSSTAAGPPSTLPLLQAQLDRVTVAGNSLQATVTVINTALISDLVGRAGVLELDKAGNALRLVCSPYTFFRLHQVVTLTISGPTAPGYDHAEAVVSPHDTYTPLVCSGG